MWIEDEEERKWYKENLSLSEFIPIMLYYNCAQGGYKYGASKHIKDISLYKNLWDILKQNWDKVVEHNGLTIFAMKNRK